MSHIILIYRQIVLYLLTGHQLLGNVYLDQLQGAHHTHTSYHDTLYFFQIFDLVNSAFKMEIGKSGLAYRKCDKYKLKDQTRKHLDDMWVAREGRKVTLATFWV